MSGRPTRLTFVMTHPVQYCAPWFRHIAAHVREIDLTVLYVARPDADQQGTGFGRAFAWDVPLTDGYRHRVLLPDGGQARRFDSHSFLGLDAPEIGRAIEETAPDAVVVPGWHSASLVRAIHACRRRRIPALYRGDSNLLTGPRGVSRTAWAVKTRFMLRLFDGYLAVGTRSREYLQRFGVPDPLIFDSPHVVDNEFFATRAERDRRIREDSRAALGIAPGDMALLFAGKLHGHKRPLDVIEAAHRLGPNTVVMIAGDGPLRDVCRRAAERLEVRVAWLGFTNQTEMPRAYSLADCLVLPSETNETWGLVVNEAMAAGLPCVVSDRVGAAPDLIEPGRTGEIHHAGDIAGLVDAVRLVQRYTHDVQGACRETADRFTFDRATDGLVAAAARVVSRVAAAGNPGSPRVLTPCGGMVMVSGVERMSFEILRVLRDRGAAVHCVVNTWGSARIVDRADEIGASWSTGYYWYPFTRKMSPVAWMQSAWDTAMTSAGLLLDAWVFRPTHVFVPDFTAALRNAPALWLLRHAGVPVILRLGNPPETGSFYRRLWRSVLNPLVDRFIANSNFTRQQLLANDVPADKSVTIRNTIPRRRLAPAHAVHAVPGRVIYVGQIIPTKGLDLLLDAIAILAGRGMDVSLDVVGNIDGWEPESYSGYRAKIRQRAASGDLAGRITFLGVREDVPDLMRRAVVHCCPSRPEQPEGFGLVNIEAKQAGVPSVVCPIGALPEIVRHRVDGWICRDVSAEAIAEGLGYFLSQPDVRADASRRARESASEFNIERFADAWAEVFGLAAPAAEVAAAAS